MLKVTVLGCDGGYQRPGGACSGYLVTIMSGKTCGNNTGAGELNILVDAGPGSLANLQNHIDIALLDGIVISHEHPDHRSDLEGISVAWKWGLGRSDLPVYAPAGVRSWTYHHESGALDWITVEDGDAVELGVSTMHFSKTDHGPETLALRIDNAGVSVGYSADTGADWSLSALGPGLDLAICEASFTAEKEGSMKHLSARQAGESALQAGVGELVITHRWPTVDPRLVLEEAREAFGREVLQAQLDAVYDLRDRGVGLSGGRGQ